MAVGHAVVHYHLLAVTVGVAEGRRQEDDGAGRKAVGDVDTGQHALQIGERGGKERGVLRGDQQRVVAELAAAGDERQRDQFLLAEPAQDVAAQRRKRSVEAVDEARLLRWTFVGHHHAVGIAPPHVGLGVVHGHAVAAAGDRRFHDAAVAGHVVGYLVLGLLAGLTEGQLQELIAAARHQYFGRGLQRRHHIGWQAQPPPRGQLVGRGRRPHQRFSRSHGSAANVGISAHASKAAAALQEGARRYFSAEVGTGFAPRRRSVAPRADGVDAQADSCYRSSAL